MQNKNIFSITGLVIAAVLILVINLLSNLIFSSARLDLTDGNIYSLSDGTKNIISKIEEPITLRLYFSKKLLSDIPQISNYGKRVSELLLEYENTSDGDIKLIIVDPEPFSEQEDQAVQYGIQALPLGDGRTKAYFGLIGVNATDKEEVIPFFQTEKEDSLEYEITKLINSLSDSSKKTVGLMTSLPMSGAAPTPPNFMQQGGSSEWYILTQLKQFFTVSTLETSVETIPADIDVLLLAHVKDISDKTQYAIDQFVLNGGHALIFVDPFSEADAPQAAQQNPQAAMNAVRDSNMEKLFKSWGVELEAGKIVADRISASRVGVNTAQGVQPVEYVVWLSLTPDRFNQDDFVTNSLKSITMGSAGHIKILTDSKPDADNKETKADKDDKYQKTITPLIQTSQQSMTVDQMQFRFGANPITLLQNFKSENTKFNIAVRINGLTQTAFPDGIEGQKDGLKESKEPINVIVVSDSDMLEDKFWVNIQNFLGQKIAMPRANNDAFLINAIDNLSGSNDLISLRTRGRSSRPFTTVQNLQREAEQRFRQKEKTLQAELNATEQKLASLQQQKQGQNSAILSMQQRKEIENFQTQQLNTRKELRAVQHELGKNIESLGTKLRFINIALIPLIIALLAIYLGVRRVRRTPTSV